MRLCNEVITVLNASYDFDADADVFLPTVISGASWFLRDNITVNNAGFKNTSGVVVRIPVDADFGGAAYVEPENYTPGSGTWTLRAGDMIVKGALTGSGIRPSELAGITDKMTVTSVTDNRRAPNAKHWRVSGS